MMKLLTTTWLMVGVCLSMQGLQGWSASVGDRNSVHPVQGEAELDAQLEAAEDKLVVVKFYATWCGHSQRIAPILEQLAADTPGVVFLEVEVDEGKNEDLFNKYTILAYPTFVFFKNGTSVERLKGANETKLKKLVAEHQ